MKRMAITIGNALFMGWTLFALAGCAECKTCCACECRGSGCVVHATIHSKCMTDCEKVCRDECARSFCPFVSGEECSGDITADVSTDTEEEKDPLASCSSWQADEGMHPNGAVIDQGDTIYLVTYYYRPENDKIFALTHDGAAFHQLWVWEAAEGVMLNDPLAGNDGRVYIPTFDGVLHALSAADGSAQWQFQAGDEVYTPAVGHDGAVLVRSRDRYLYSLNPGDGSERWRQSVGNILHRPVVGIDGTIFVNEGGQGGALLALEPAAGGRLWSYEPEEMDMFYLGTPSVGSDGTLYVAYTSYTGSERLVALNPADASQQWSEYVGSSIRSVLVGPDGRLFVKVETYDGYAIMSINPADGSELWSYASPSEITHLAAGSDGTMAAITAGPSSSRIYGIDPGTGTELWSFVTGYTIFAPVVDSGGRVFVSCDDGFIHALHCL